MPLVWWLHIILHIANFNIFVATFVTKIDPEKSQVQRPPMQPEEKQHHFHSSSKPIPSVDLKRQPTHSVHRDQTYLNHSNTSIGRVTAKHETFQEHRNNNNSSRKSPTGPDPIPVSGPLNRIYLYNKCSDSYVWMTANAIFANGSKFSPSGEFEVQTVSRGKDGTPTFTIRGLVSKKFICFNKHGRIVVKSRGRGRLCRFQDSIDSNYILYQSEVNRSWFLSFSENGKRLSVQSQSQRKNPGKCQRFLRYISVNNREDSTDVQSSSGFTDETKKLDTFDHSRDRTTSRRHNRNNHQKRHHNKHSSHNIDETKF